MPQGRKDFRSFTRELNKGGFPTIREFEKQHEKKQTKTGMTKFKKQGNAFDEVVEDPLTDKSAALKKSETDAARQDAFQERNRQMQIANEKTKDKIRLRDQKRKDFLEKQL